MELASLSVGQNILVKGRVIAIDTAGGRHFDTVEVEIENADHDQSRHIRVDPDNIKADADNIAGSNVSIDGIVSGEIKVIKTVSKRFTSAELLAIKANPVELLPALTDGSYRIPLYSSLVYDPGNTDYTQADATNIRIYFDTVWADFGPSLLTQHDNLLKLGDLIRDFAGLFPSIEKFSSAVMVAGGGDVEPLTLGNGEAVYTLAYLEVVS